MTADGPDMGTPEYKEAWQRGTVKKYLASRYKIIRREIQNPPPWEIIEEETLETMGRLFGEDMDKKPGKLYIAAVATFAEATGGLPKDKESLERLLALIAPAVRANGRDIIGRLLYIMGAAQRLNAAAKYKKGEITPELAAILTDEYEWTPEIIREKYLAESTFLLPYLIDEKKIDFSPFKGKADKGDDWYFDYAIRISPLNKPAGYPAVTLGRIADTAGKEYLTGITQLKEVARQHMEGLKPTDEMLRRAGISGGNWYQIVAGYIIPPQDPESFLQLAEAIELQYQRRQKERTRKDYAAPYNTPQEAGFYVNPVTCKIYDLRPYHKELHRLFSVNSWLYLKTAAAAIREAVAEYRGEELPRKKRETTPPPSIFDKAFIKMFNATPTNNLININTSKSGRPEAESGYFEQNMFSGEWEYKKGGTELNIPVKHENGTPLLPLFTTSTWKIMHFISLLFTAQNSLKQQNGVFPVVETNIREYILATGRKMTPSNIKDTTKILKRDLDTLAKISIKYNDKKYSLSRVNPFAETHINRGKIRVVLAPTFAEFLVKTTGLLTNYPAALLKLKENNSNLFPLGYKLALNRSNDANIRRGKANILSVPVCLSCCPGIPSIERVRKEGRGYSPAKRIIEPFERTLDTLQEQGVLERWEYCLPKGEPLGQPDVTDYNYFASLYILYEIKDFPIGDELPRIQATAEKRKRHNERVERYTEKAIAKKKAEELTKTE